MKTVEEVIDVVGDFGPGPMKQLETSFQPDDTFGMSFDVSSIPDDQQLQDPSIMMPPSMGKFSSHFHFQNNFYLTSQKDKTTTTVNKLPKR